MAKKGKIADPHAEREAAQAPGDRHLGPVADPRAFGRRRQGQGGCYRPTSLQGRQRRR